MQNKVDSYKKIGYWIKVITGFVGAIAVIVAGLLKLLYEEKNMFSTVVTVAISDSYYVPEIQKQLETGVGNDLRLIISKNICYVEADVYITDNEEYARTIRKDCCLACIFVILKPERIETIKELITLHIDGVIDPMEIKIQPVIDCVRRQAESKRNMKNIRSKLTLLKQSQLQLSFD